MISYVIKERKSIKEIKLKMKLIFLCVICLLSTSLAIDSFFAMEEFTNWMKKYKPNYKTEEEKKHRFSIFKSNLASSHQDGITKYSDRSSEELASIEKHHRSLERMKERKAENLGRLPPHLELQKGTNLRKSDKHLNKRHKLGVLPWTDKNQTTIYHEGEQDEEEFYLTYVIDWRDYLDEDDNSVVGPSIAQYGYCPHHMYASVPMYAMEIWKAINSDLFENMSISYLLACQGTFSNKCVGGLWDEVTEQALDYGVMYEGQHNLNEDNQGDIHLNLYNCNWEEEDEDDYFHFGSWYTWSNNMVWLQAWIDDMPPLVYFQHGGMNDYDGGVNSCTSDVDWWMGIIVANGTYTSESDQTVKNFFGIKSSKGPNFGDGGIIYLEWDAVDTCKFLSLNMGPWW